jgi:adenylosuccinate synthase
MASSRAFFLAADTNATIAEAHTLGAQCLDRLLRMHPALREDGNRVDIRATEFVVGSHRAFDAVALRRAVRLNGVDSLVLTKLDVLSGFDKIKVCVKYILDGKEIDDLPPLAADCERVVPKYVELDGWKENLQGITKWHHLPGTARLYVSALAEMVGVPVSVVSVAPERESTFFSSSATFLENFLAER